jgi:hypothetical protein
MDRVTFVVIVLAILAVGCAAVYFLRNRRRRAQRLTMELLEQYFQGDIAADQFARRLRESGDYGFTGSAEFYAAVTAAFQRAAEAKLAHRPHPVEDENKLLRSLATLREEFGLPDRSSCPIHHPTLSALCYRVGGIWAGRNARWADLSPFCRICRETR